MITFVVGEEHQYTIREVLETRDHRLHGTIIVLPYRDFLSFPRLPTSHYIFLDHERLEPTHLQAVRKRFAALQAAVPRIKVLNPPNQYPGRLDVMHRLQAAGVNQFRVLPITDPLEDLRFPVFLRRLDNHEGPLTDLLDGPAVLHREIAALIAAGHAPETLAVTEYVDTRNDEGAHEKRCYFRVGQIIFPVALDASRNWVCKGEVSDPDSVDMVRQELAFLHSNQDEEPLRRAFDVAEITYGRADYAMVDGQPQVFEINTNPLIDIPERLPFRLRPSAILVLDRWLDALAAFSSPSRPQTTSWIPVEGAEYLPPITMSLRRRVIRNTLIRIGRLHRETEVMWRLRAILGAP